MSTSEFEEFATVESQNDVRRRRLHRRDVPRTGENSAFEVLLTRCMAGCIEEGHPIRRGVAGGGIFVSEPTGGDEASPIDPPCGSSGFTTCTSATEKTTFVVE